MARELSPFERWMVKSNLETIGKGVPVAYQVALLRQNGYPQIAEAVEASAVQGMVGGAGIIAHEQKVLGQTAYINFYNGTPVQIMQAVERELTENPARPRLEYLHIERGAYPRSGDGHAKFVLPGHTKYDLLG